jgi:hypothetical protein
MSIFRGRDINIEAHMMVVENERNHAAIVEEPRSFSHREHSGGQSFQDFRGLLQSRVDEQDVAHLRLGRLADPADEHFAAVDNLSLKDVVNGTAEGVIPEDTNGDAGLGI